MKKKTIYKCSVCDYESIGYLGKCPECNSWSSLEEIIIDKKEKSKPQSRLFKKKPIKKLKLFAL